MAKCACTAPPPPPVHTLTKTKLWQKEKKRAPANTSTPSSMHTKSRGRREGPRTKVQGPRPSLLLCAEEWRGPGAAAAGCTGHSSRSFHHQTKSGTVSGQGARLQGRGGGGGSCIQNEGHTLPAQHRADSPIDPAGQQQRRGGWGSAGWRPFL